MPYDDKQLIAMGVDPLDIFASQVINVQISNVIGAIIALPRAPVEAHIRVHEKVSGNSTNGNERDASELLLRVARLVIEMQDRLEALKVDGEAIMENVIKERQKGK